MTESERFWAKVDKGPDCWVWTGATRGYGYGQFWLSDGRKVAAHRWVMGDPEGKAVLHRCDNPPCVRPDHLYLGTQKSNMQDRLARGRNPKAEATECQNGHAYTEANTRWTKGGQRRCRTCFAATMARYRAKRREASQAPSSPRGEVST